MMAGSVFGSVLEDVQSVSPYWNKVMIDYQIRLEKPIKKSMFTITITEASVDINQTDVTQISETNTEKSSKRMPMHNVYPVPNRCLTLLESTSSGMKLRLF